MRYDESCKRLLADKEMLAIILKAIVPEYKDIPEEEIMNDYIQGNIRDTVGTEYVLPEEEHDLSDLQPCHKRCILCINTDNRSIRDSVF